MFRLQTSLSDDTVFWEAERTIQKDHTLLVLAATFHAEVKIHFAITDKMEEGSFTIEQINKHKNSTSTMGFEPLASGLRIICVFFMFYLTALDAL